MAVGSAPLRALTRREAAVLTCVARVLFPRDRSIDLDFDDVEVVTRLDDYAARLPPPQRLNLKALLAGTEVAWLAWVRRPGAAMVDADPEQLAQFLDHWSRHPNYTMRQAWMAVKSLLVMAYVEAPSVLEAIGATESAREEVA